MNQNITRRSFLSGIVIPPVVGMLQDDSGRIRRWLEAIYSTEPAAPASLTPDPASWDSDTITAAWVGHSTVLLNFFGTIILTDPVFSDRVGLNIGGLFTLGPKRLVAPALPLESLPPIDLVLISHGHMDHCDIATLEKMSRTTPIIMPRNTTTIIDGVNFERLDELDWAEWTTVKEVRVEALPVEHKGWRYPWSQRSPDGSGGGPGSNAYLLSRNDVNIVVAGDTAYQEHFKDLGRRGLSIELAVLPIGGYIPHHDNHCTPEEALLMADHMNAKHILPIHWGTFPGEEGLNEPIERLRRSMASEPERIAVDRIGQTWKKE